MEWHIMNAGGITSLCSNLGSVEKGTFLPSDECEEVLQELIGQFEQDDVLCTLQQMFCVGIIEKELVPLIKYLKDDPDIFSEAVRLMTLLTQPVECIQHQGKTQPPRDLAKSQALARRSCLEEIFLAAIFNEINTIITDAGDYNLLEESIVTINNCLLLLRNLLYLPETDTERGINDLHVQHLRLMMSCGLGDTLLTLLSKDQRERWSLVIIQILPLLYKTTISDFLQPKSERTDLSDQSSQVSEPLVDVVVNVAMDSECGVSINSKVSLSSLRESMSTCMLEAGKSIHCEVAKQENETKQEEKAKPSSSNVSVNTLEEDNSEDTVFVSCEDLDPDQDVKQIIHDFTCKFINNGFCNLISDVTHILIGKRGEVDDLCLLWAISFFCKFSRNEIMCRTNIRDILKLEVFGFITYECVLYCEEVVRGSNPDSLHSHMRKLHLCVAGLNELLRMLIECQQEDKFCQESRNMYLDKLHRELASLTDLRQLFVFLVRKFDVQNYMYNVQFLKDLVSANHQYLLLIETWMTKGYCGSQFGMLEHIKQFATVEVMQRYGCLLQYFNTNGHYINNCILTMMHHIAGDCERSDVLIQADIINMFLELLDNDELDQEINDLIQYVLKQFVKHAENNPYICASQMFGDGKIPHSQSISELEDSDWTSDDDDMLIMYYMDLSNETDIITKIQHRFSDIGREIPQTTILSQLLNSDWIQDCDKELLIDDTTDQTSVQTEATGRKRKHEVLEHKLESSEDEHEMEETGVLTFCAKKLRKNGHGKHVSWLQNVLCEATYIKLSGDIVQKDEMVEEPVLKYHILQKKSMPLVLYNMEQEQMLDNNHFCRLLEHLGMHMPNDVNRLFPRIPFFWSARQLFDKAQQLGPLDADMLKFNCQDMCRVKGSFEEFSSEFGDSSYKSNKAIKHAELTDRVAHNQLLSESLWMNFVHSYNLQALSS